MEGINSAQSESAAAEERPACEDISSTGKGISKGQGAKEMAVVGSHSHGDSSDASSEDKSKKEIKSVSQEQSKDHSKATSEGGNGGGEGGGKEPGGGGGGKEDLPNAGVIAELARTQPSPAAEVRPRSERRSSGKSKRPSITTEDSSTEKAKGGDAHVTDGSPDENKSGKLPAETEKPEMGRAVDKWKKVALKTGSRMSLHQVVKSVPTEYLTRARGSEVIQPTVNGLRQFGISKGEISRVVVKFSSPPTPHPLTICFHFPSTFLTHRYVLDMIRVLIQGVEGSRVTSIQFIDRNTIHGARGLDNRWLVTLNSPVARDVILGQGLQLFNRRILVRTYDDILREEYEEFLEYTQIRRKLYVQTEDVAIKEEVEDRAAVDEDDLEGEQPGPYDS